MLGNVMHDAWDAWREYVSGHRVKHATAQKVVYYWMHSHLRAAFDKLL
jgi:tagatose-1,6-bisphosphate aldolase non-catalytic subunit AgaZ/GatZ